MVFPYGRDEPMGTSDPEPEPRDEDSLRYLADVKDPSITTYTNKEFFLTRPTPEIICIEDIAHGLSNICRYVGQCQPFYSVAEHSIRMAWLVDSIRNWEDPDEYRNAQLAALLHDSAEAYIGDVSSGLKHLFPRLMEIEDRILATVLDMYGVKMIPEIKDLDVTIRVTEVMNLLPRGHAGWSFEDPESYEPIIPWSPQIAETSFLGMFKELTDGNHPN